MEAGRKSGDNNPLARQVRFEVLLTKNLLRLAGHLGREQGDLGA